MLNLKPDWNEGLLLTFGLAIGLILGGVFFSGAAYSNPPIPRANEHQQIGSNNSQKTTHTERGTEQSPLFVKEVSTPQRNKEASDIADDANQEAANNHFLLCINIVLATFAGLTLVAIARQSYLLNRQTKLARAEFNATHRPEIVILSFVQPGNIENMADDYPVAANISYLNKGTADAVGVSIRAIIQMNNWAPEEGIEIPPLKELPDAARGVIQTVDVLSKFSAKEIASKTALRGFEERETRPALPYCIGRISYRDESGSLRHMGFCRKWDGYVWETVENSPYNYAY